eukprot:5089501-Amphidinium_carterae.1
MQKCGEVCLSIVDVLMPSDTRRGAEARSTLAESCSWSSQDSRGIQKCSAGGYLVSIPDSGPGKEDLAVVSSLTCCVLAL